MDFKEWLNLAEMPMMMPQTLPENIIVRIFEGSDEIMIHVYDRPIGKVIGQAVMRKEQSGYWSPHTRAEQGYGPLIYDLAIEYATQKNSGVIPASGNNAGMNTGDSSAVWKYYLEKRSDVQHALPDWMDSLDEWSKKQFKKSPWLFYIYRKPPILTNELIQLSKLAYRKWKGR